MRSTTSRPAMPARCISPARTAPRCCRRTATLTNGVGTFSATLKTAGTQTITATDTARRSDHGDQQRHRRERRTGDALRRRRAAGSHGGHRIQRSRSRHWTPSTTRRPATPAPCTSPARDGAAVLPADATLTSGAGTFSATLATAGSADASRRPTRSRQSITGTSNAIVVSPRRGDALRGRAPPTAAGGHARSTSRSPRSTPSTTRRPATPARCTSRAATARRRCRRTRR